MEAANTMAWTQRGAIIACLILSGCEQPAPPPASATLVRAMAVQVTNFKFAFPTVRSPAAATRPVL
jgi:hypothetical protein